MSQPMNSSAMGFVVSAPSSGSGKTLVSLGLARLFAEDGVVVAPVKSGPDYIDPQFLSRAADAACLNLDAWAMGRRRLTFLATQHASKADVLLIEGAMGLFDGALGGAGSTADLAAILGLPVVLVVDASRMAQSVGALARGFKTFRPDVQVGGVILNKVGSDKHERMLREALAGAGIACIGALPRSESLAVPSRHLGLVEPGVLADAEAMIVEAARIVRNSIDLSALAALAGSVLPGSNAQRLPPLGQRIAIARDAAFTFTYEHWLRDWRNAGAELTYFSPLADEIPDPGADAVYLPGGYPELHGSQLAEARQFRAGLARARNAGALIYGECGGYMVLGESLTDAQGETHRMAGLLPHTTKIDQPRRTLGYRQLRHQGPLPFARNLRGHEFHYSSQSEPQGEQLFSASDAEGARLRPMGTVQNRVCGSYAHVIDSAEAATP